MAKTNEPVFKNSTGQKIISAIDRETSLLSMIAEGQRSTVYSNITQIANIVRNGFGELSFPIGDQIIIPWKDMDDSSHNTDETAYQVPLDIVHHGDVELEDGEIVPGMFLQWHYATPYGVQFSHQQAFIPCPAGLAAGQYHVTWAYTWGSFISGESWNFTLTQAVPAGGRLSGFETNASGAWNVKSWATPTSTTPLETVSVAAGAVGTSLGTMNYTTANAGLNCMQRVAYGSNRWKTSGIRQYLNAAGTSWFASQSDYDIRPDEYSKHGFKDGFAADFLAAIKPVKVVTALNTVEGYTDQSEVTDDSFFLPSLEQINCTPESLGVEGDYFEYWRRRLGVSGYANRHPTVYDGYKIPAINALTTPQNVRLRSAFRGIAYLTRYVNTSGSVYNYYASTSLRSSPVCVIA